jgi:peptide methionine sulfoxide reductase msrA/msrB
MRNSIFILILAAMMALLIYAGGGQESDSPQVAEPEIALDDPSLATAVFAGGCFWCTEADFEKLDGVIEAVSGYAGGDEENPTYQQVAAGATGHIESVMVYYDPELVSYEELVDYHWRYIDPTDPDGQFVDRGPHYRTAIFYENQEQLSIARESRQRLIDSGVFDEEIVTDFIPLTRFWVAEEYHQDYYLKNSMRYNFYRSGSGRDQFLEEVWGAE